MTITREQVADLQPGDVVQIEDGYGVAVSGPLHRFIANHSSAGLAFGASALVVRRSDGELASEWTGWNLTVVSRAPRPLYVNHPRTKPVRGDVVTDDDAPRSVVTWTHVGPNDWLVTGTRDAAWGLLAPRLRLLVDGETGEVVR